MLSRGSLRWVHPEKHFYRKSRLQHHPQPKKVLSLEPAGLSYRNRSQRAVAISGLERKYETATQQKPKR